jgi:Response regulator containing CheY-like receiver, AAA-type ATPase, and DNA-binding domains
MGREEGVSSAHAEKPALVCRILVVEDEVLFSKAVCRRLTKAGFQCERAGTLAEAWERFAVTRPDIILLDMRLPDGSGLDFLKELRERDASDVPVVVLTAYGELQDAVAAMKLKASDYLKKPLDLEELLLVLRKALERMDLSRRLDYSRQRESQSMEGVELLGESLCMRRVREQIERIGSLSARAQATPPTVLILGETGCGKDLAARLLHRSSARCNRPFVHVDCAALPKDLIEAELFGHEKGAFTNAHTARTGLIEAAEDGSVYLDEIAELLPPLQSKLLAVLERRTVRRVGSTREHDVAAWFIAATNRDLEAMVREGQFRPDLYYRLKVLMVTVPPLRARGDDVILLARHFVALTARRYGFKAPELTEDAEAALRAYNWPGNVRELKHLVERAMLLNGGVYLTAAALMLEGGQSAVTPAAAGQELEGLTLDAAESTLIAQALQRTGGNVSEAARQLGITRMALRYRLQKYGISLSSE